MSWGGENLIEAGVVSSNPRGEREGRNTWEGLDLERRRDRPSFPKIRASGFRDRASLKLRGKWMAERMPTDLGVFNKAV